MYLSEARIRRNREIRDIYRKLRNKYKTELLLQFFFTNYFIKEDAFYSIIGSIDDEPVSEPSIQYNVAMRDSFKL